MARKTERLTIWPFTRLTLRPFCRISRRMIISSPISKPCSSKISCKRRLFSTEKSPSISAFGAPWRIMSVVARAPNMRFIASIMIDFPAPVSPVKIVIPFSKLSEIASIMAKFFIEISSNILTYHFLTCSTISSAASAVLATIKIESSSARQLKICSENASTN